MARAGDNFTKDPIHEKPPVALPVLTPEQEKLRKEGRRITQGRLGLGYQKEKPIKIYGAQTKPIKITRKTSADVHQVSVGQTPTKKKNASNPVIIYTLRAAIARACAYDSITVNHISVAYDNQEDDEFILDESLATFEECGQSTVDELKKVDLGTTDDPRPTFLSASLSAEEEVKYMSLLHEYRDIFAWNYTEMEVKYPSCIANIVPVNKKNGQIQVCIKFRNLNKACPKDDFPLPIIELMVDATTGHGALSFIDGSSGYNQIRMDPKDEELTAFRTPKGIFCYKNAGVKYQRAMQNIFDDFLHKRVECYVDDLVVKTKERSDHLLDHRAVFERLRRFQLEMNPLKCAFGVTSGKFLGFVVHHRGIEIDQSKIDAIQKMSEPRNITELKSFQGHLAYIRCFISYLAERYQLFSRFIKKYTSFEWDESCRNAFNNIKVYLTKPPVLVAPIVDRPLLVYVAAREKSVGALLAHTGGRRTQLHTD
ncbi:hypothetical protein H6P81_010301 [Aristolochia fimbriata]|uniref:Reverse transcriptase domain-containing protein n=1 Tax=Aristolochia fimbriata TaxID=158543 RepID=A0AAV7EPI6_ARIFI|nr:hypothetical protein H6P81_010301 [Aristolochia fimbriata]